jgi:hypothetical protein
MGHPLHRTPAASGQRCPYEVIAPSLLRSSSMHPSDQRQADTLSTSSQHSALPRERPSRGPCHLDESAPLRPPMGAPSMPPRGAPAMPPKLPRRASSMLPSLPCTSHHITMPTMCTIIVLTAGPNSSLTASDRKVVRRKRPRRRQPCMSCGLPGGLLSHLIFKPKPNAHSMCAHESGLHTYHIENSYKITNVTIYNLFTE